MTKKTAAPKVLLLPDNYDNATPAERIIERLLK